MDLGQTTEDIFKELLNLREIKFPFEYGNPFALEPKIKYYVDKTGIELSPDVSKRLFNDIASEIKPQIDTSMTKYHDLINYTNLLGLANSAKAFIELYLASSHSSGAQGNPAEKYIELLDGGLHLASAFHIDSNYHELTDSVSFGLYLDYSLVQMIAGVYAVGDVPFQNLVGKISERLKEISSINIPFISIDDEIRSKLKEIQLNQGILSRIEKIYSSGRIQQFLQAGIDAPDFPFQHELVLGMMQETVLKAAITPEYVKKKLSAYSISN